MLPASLSFTSAFIIGLLGTTHCLVMCGGLASSLSLGGSGKANSLLGLFSYNLGRIASYCAAGALLGLLGATIQQTEIAFALRWIAGLLLISMGLYIAQWWFGLTKLEQAGSLLWKQIAPLLKPFMPADTPFKALVLGIGWGWLPCGLVYSTLIWSSAAGSVAESTLLMLGFGLGTLPAMLATGLLAKQLRELVAHTLVRKLSGLLLILMGMWTLLSA